MTLIDGTFDGMENPILYPPNLKQEGGDYIGLAIGKTTGKNNNNEIKVYSISSNAKIYYSYPNIVVGVNELKLFNKSFPMTPTNGTYTLKSINGSFTWVAD